MFQFPYGGYQQTITQENHCLLPKSILADLFLELISCYVVYFWIWLIKFERQQNLCRASVLLCKILFGLFLETLFIALSNNCLLVKFSMYKGSQEHLVHIENTCSFQATIS